MKKFLLLIVTLLIYSFVNAQPCKKVKIGMSSSEVLKVAGKPTEVDSIGANSEEELIVWQYGEVRKPGNQRIQFVNGKVDQVIADGKKFDDLMVAIQNGSIPKSEMPDRLEKLNQEGC